MHARCALESSLSYSGGEITIDLTRKVGICLYGDGRWKEVEELQLQVMETTKRVLGQENPDTLRSMNNLAFTWKGYGRDAETFKLMEECMRLGACILGANHAHIVSARPALLGWQTEELETGALADKDPGV